MLLTAVVGRRAGSGQVVVDGKSTVLNPEFWRVPGTEIEVKWIQED